MMLTSFAFKQRSNKLNWLQISSLNVDQIISTSNISDLQSIIDEITFSNFDQNDVKFIDIDNLSKLVRLMQLAIEYLLHCQESQCKYIHNIQQKYNKSKKINNDLIKNNITNKDLITTYKKQVNHLKAVIDGDESYKPYNTTNNNNNDQNYDQTTVLPLISTILNSEKETRQSILITVENQKTMFINEINKLYDIFNNNIQQTKDNNKDNLIYSIQQVQIKDTITSFFTRIESLIDTKLIPIYTNYQLQQQQDENKREIDQNKPKLSPNYDENEHTKKELIEKHIMINNLTNTIEIKTNEINKLSLLLREKEHIWSVERSELLSLTHIQTNHIESQKYTFTKAKLLAVRMMRVVLNQGKYIYVMYIVYALCIPVVCACVYMYIICVCHTLHCISISSYLHAVTYYITYTLIYTLLYTHIHMYYTYIHPPNSLSSYAQ